MDAYEPQFFSFRCHDFSPTKINNIQTNEIYDLQSYNEAAEFGGEPIQIGKLIKKPDGKFRFVKN